MNIVLPEGTKTSKKQWIAYITIITICIISVVIAFYVQFYGRIDLFGTKDVSAFGSKDEDTLIELEEGFSQIFTNQINNEESEYNNKKELDNVALVYTKYSQQENKINSYNLDVAIPNINIKSDVVSAYNEEIEKTFVDTGREILNKENQNIIYQVNYTATVEEGILSLVIQSILKEGSDAQRLIIKTYNYDLRNDKEISLEEILKVKKIDTATVQAQIKDKIKKEHESAQSLISMGYTVLDRDVENSMYEISNTKEFYLTNDTLYIIYPYGNTKSTNEMDLIII